jgi:AcrR family transcriptional regulator
MPAGRAAHSSDGPPGGTLRAAYKALTRERIREAAKALFIRTSVSATTIDQITAAAGISRPTFYVHYCDKEAVVAEIVSIFATSALEFSRKFPGPTPSLKQIRVWLDEMVKFYSAERMSLALLYQAGHGDPEGVPDIVHTLMDQTIVDYAERVPAFRVALTPGAHQLHARARAEMMVRQITSACEFCAREGATPMHRATLDVTAEAIFELLAAFNAISATRPDIE